MARRSELVALNVKDFEINEDEGAMVTFEQLKTGVQATDYLSPEVVVGVRECLVAAHIEEGAVFTGLDLAAGKKNARMTGQSVNLAFKRVAKMLNLPELDPARISGHSVRIGTTQDLVEDGASNAAIMRDAGWKTPQLVACTLEGQKPSARYGA